jgi:hypothetical protein
VREFTLVDTWVFTSGRAGQVASLMPEGVLPRPLYSAVLSSDGLTLAASGKAFVTLASSMTLPSM